MNAQVIPPRRPLVGDNTIPLTLDKPRKRARPATRKAKVAYPDKAALLAQVDAEIPKARAAALAGSQNRREDVPLFTFRHAHGSWSVRWQADRLERFRSKIARAGGFSKPARKAHARTFAEPGNATLRDMLGRREFHNALEYCRLIGQGVRIVAIIPAPRDGLMGKVFLSCESVDVQGLTLFSGQSYVEGVWGVFDPRTGLHVGGAHHETRAAALTAARDAIAKVGADKVRELIASEVSKGLPDETARLAQWLAGAIDKPAD